MNDITDQLINKLSNSSERYSQQFHRTPLGFARCFFADNLLNEELVLRSYEELSSGRFEYFQRESFRERKRTCTNLGESDSAVANILYSFQHPEVVKEICKIVQIDSLEVDKSLYAGGVSKMCRGDFLNPHIDNSHDASRSRYRRLNLLFYVSPNWLPEFGGNLELWDPCVKNNKIIDSVFNRLVVMETNKDSWHSVSRVNVDRSRFCISNYYFSSSSPSRPPEERSDYFHVTRFTGRPEQRFTRLLSYFDNGVRQILGERFGLGRGRMLLNKTTE